MQEELELYHKEKYSELLIKPNLLMSEQVALTNYVFDKKWEGYNDVNPDYWQQLKDQANLIQEELNELFKALEEQNLTQIRDATGDILVTGLGVSHLGNLPIEEDMKSIFESNLSKVCKDLKDLELTMNHYKNLGVDVYCKSVRLPSGEGWVVKVKEDCYDNTEDKKFYPKNKFLKSVTYFKEPVFVGLIYE